MNRFLFSMIAVLCVANVSWAQVKTSSQDTVVTQMKLRKAEQVIVRAMRKFGQTLDFKDVYREFYVKDKTVRQGEIKRFFNDLIETETLEKSDKAILEKLFVKFNNVVGLLELSGLSDTYISKTQDEIKDKLNSQQIILFERIVKEI